MEIIDAQKFVDEKITQYGGYWEPLSMMARVTEETGEVARAINIKFGGKKSKFKGDGDGELKDELGDLMFTILALANSMDINMEEALTKKMEKSHELYTKTYSE